MNMKKIALYLFAFIVPFFSVAQDAPEVSLIICDPGSDIYELEGHAAMRFRFSDGRDVIVNWGLFDFNSPNFIYRFVKGETDYRVGTSPAVYFIDAYGRHNRRVTEYPLNLTPDEALRALEAVENNLLPENAVYRYNYVKDNCSTRPVAIIERAVGDSISFEMPDRLDSPEVSFRDVMSYYHTNYPWYQFGIDLALGSGIDYPLSVRERIFAPVLLERMLSDAKFADGRPVVTGRTYLNGIEENVSVAGPTPWYLTPLAISIVVLILTVLISLRDLRRNAVTRWFDAVLFSIFGMAGLLLTFLIFVSVHEATSPNWLYLWLNPFAFIYVVGMWIKRMHCLVYCYQIVNFVALISLLIIGLLGVQSLNVAFYPLIISGLLRSIIYVYLSKCRVKNNC